MSLSAARVVGFDAYGTLFDIAAVVDVARAELGDKADPLFRLWRRRQVEISWLPLNCGDAADFWRVTGEALDFAMHTLSVTDRDGLRTRLMEAWLNVAPYPEVAESLARLRALGLPLAILTNGTKRMITAAAASCGMDALLHEVLTAEQAGCFKPDGAVYALLADRFATEPERVCFVSANPWDAGGAAAFGFQVVWIDREGLPAEKWPGGIAARIESLTELPDALMEAKNGRA